MSEKKHYHRGRRRSSSPAGSRGSSRDSSRDASGPTNRSRITEEDWENDWIDLEEDEDLRTPDQVKAKGKRRAGSGGKAAAGKKKGKTPGKSEKKNGRKGRLVSNIILVVAIIVFCVSAFQLFRILSGYYEGRKEYDEVKELAVTEEETAEGEPRFKVDFDALLGINPDTVGWIRFDPEPSQIDYPLVQTTDNSTYLNKTFSASDNTVGAIFVNTYNNPDFNDRNTIVYGHRMNDSSMFHDLPKYEEKSLGGQSLLLYLYAGRAGDHLPHICGGAGDGDIGHVSDRLCR